MSEKISVPKKKKKKNKIPKKNKNQKKLKNKIFFIKINLK